MSQTANLNKVKQKLLHHLQQGDHAKAGSIYRKHRNSRIRDIELWQMFANVNSNLGDLPEVIHCCERIVEIDSDNLQALFNIAACNQNLGRFGAAAENYRRVVAIDPANIQAHRQYLDTCVRSGSPDAALSHYDSIEMLHGDTQCKSIIGDAYENSGEYRTAIGIFEEILAAQPADARALFKLGHLNYIERAYQDAERYYLQYINQHPDDYRAHNNLGRLYDESGLYDRAITMYERSIELDDTNALIYRNLAKSQISAKEFDAALDNLDRSLEIDDEHPESYFLKGSIFSKQNRRDEARTALGRAASLPIPDDIENKEEFTLTVNFFLSAIDGDDSLNESKNEFIKDLFDSLSDNFDSHLVETLKYRTPQVISQAIDDHCTADGLNILDLGCGTGLCAEFLKPKAERLVGVDISPGMVEKAEALGVYDELIVDEIVNAMNASENEYDLFVAADVFVYIGALEETFASIATRSRPDAMFIFSTESLPADTEQDHILFDTGRYKHSRHYIDRLASEHGFEVCDTIESTLRVNKGEDVAGNIFVLKLSGNKA